MKGIPNFTSQAYSTILGRDVTKVKASGKPGHPAARCLPPKLTTIFGVSPKTRSASLQLPHKSPTTSRGVKKNPKFHFPPQNSSPKVGEGGRSPFFPSASPEKKNEKRQPRSEVRRCLGPPSIHARQAANGTGALTGRGLRRALGEPLASFGHGSKARLSPSEHPIQSNHKNRFENGRCIPPFT